MPGTTPIDHTGAVEDMAQVLEILLAGEVAIVPADVGYIALGTSERAIRRILAAGGDGMLELWD